MLYSDGEATLKAMLAARGINLDGPEPLATWETFKEFASVSVEGVDPEAGDMLLFQWGAYDWQDGKGERFEVDFTRQFVILASDGDYDHMEQLHCTLYYEPSERLRAFEDGNEWVEGDLENGLHCVESLPVFAVLRDALTMPVHHRIEQDQV